MRTSVAICTYNGEKYILEQLESIVNQTRAVDEIIICDDCSIDNSVRITRDFIRRHREITIQLYINSENLGFLKNFEQTLARCSGDIIFLSDQDDIWMPNKVEKIYQYFNEHPDIDFVFSNAFLLKSNGTACYSKTLFDAVGLDEKNKSLFNQGYVLELLATYGRVTGCTSALRASFLPYCLPFPSMHIRPIHDEIIAVRAASSDKIKYIDDCLIKYRQHSKQTIGISLMLKFPPRHWGQAPEVRTWNKEMIDPILTHVLSKQCFIEDRFWMMRNRFGALKLTFAFISGQYNRFYGQAFRTFMIDLKGTLIRPFKKREHYEAY